MTTTQPTVGYWIFRGHRDGYDGGMREMYEPVAIIEVWKGREKELAVVTTGHATRWALSRFHGEWIPLELGEQVSP